MRRFFVLALILAALITSPQVVLPAANGTQSREQQLDRSAAAASQPVRLRIPAIKLNQRLITVGLDRQRRPVVPKHDVGWYKDSARPGQGENVVMWGHVLRWKDTPRTPAPFEKIHLLRLGAEIFVDVGNGTTFRYRVTRKVQVKPSEVRYILPVGAERLTLVSCIGDNVVVNGRISKEYRLVTIAEPVR